MPRLASLLTLLSFVTLASCTEFDKRWDATSPPMSADPAALMSGKWEGTWQSDATSYNGHLQAIIVPTEKVMVDKVERQGYRAEFKQRLFELAFNEYDVKFTAITQPDGRVRFEGRKDLGYYNGGIWRFSGYILPGKDMFYCDYDSDKDSGTFKMRRISQDTQ
jgi:hypothetical protein